LREQVSYHVTGDSFSISQEAKVRQKNGEEKAQGRQEKIAVSYGSSIVGYIVAHAAHF
jgi:hypothetical protein